MQHSEKLSLKWNDFQENLNSAFGVLRNDKDFADVTLVCEDGTHIETHKVILASSSPFFMEMLKKNKHPHPMIYMRGMDADTLVAMVDFLYYGEANLTHENLDVFLGLAEELRLKGLTGLSNESNIEEITNKTVPPDNNIKEMKNVETTFNGANQSNVYNPVAKAESSPVALVSAAADQLDQQVRSMMTRTEHEIIRGTKKEKAFACYECGKEGQWSNIKTHIEANHIANTSHSCNICGKISRSRHGLRLNKAKEHCKQTFLQDEGRLEKPQKEPTSQC